MVSQRASRASRPRHAEGSRERLLAAAAQEFAARGFDGAKVDRIAARAHLNKAMLYYHFEHKAALYREILHDVFGAAAEAVEAVQVHGGDPEEQLRAFIAAIAGSAVTRPHFPSIWLREMAEGGRHLNAPVIAQMRRVMLTLAGILEMGRRAGTFRHVHPLIAQMGIVAPLLFFAASAPVRTRLGHHAPFPLGEVTPQAVLEHVQNATLSALRTDPAAPRRTLR
jgi:TetR/AcrR family transcriptional regulator